MILLNQSDCFANWFVCMLMVNLASRISEAISEDHLNKHQHSPIYIYNIAFIS